MCVCRGSTSRFMTIRFAQRQEYEYSSARWFHPACLDVGLLACLTSAEEIRGYFSLKPADTQKLDALVKIHEQRPQNNQAKAFWAKKFAKRGSKTEKSKQDGNTQAAFSDDESDDEGRKPLEKKNVSSLCSLQGLEEITGDAAEKFKRKREDEKAQLSGVRKLLECPGRLRSMCSLQAAA